MPQFDPDKIAQFRQQALAQGANPQEVDSFIQQKTGQGQPQQPGQSNSGSFADTVGNIPVLGGLVNTATGLGRDVAAAGFEAIPTIKAALNPNDPNAQAEAGSIRQRDPFLTNEQKFAFNQGSGSTIGQVAKDTAGTASFLVPGGEATGFLGKAANLAKQGATQGALYNASQPGEFNPTSVATGAAEGLAGNALLGGATKAIGNKLSGTAGKTLPSMPSSANPDSLENRFLAAQFQTVPNNMASKVQDTVTSLNNSYGLKSPDDYIKLYNSGSGDLGALTSLRRGVVDRIGPVDLGANFDLNMQGILQDHGIDPASATGKDILAPLKNIKQGVTVTPGRGSFGVGYAGQGTSATTAEAASIYKVMQRLGALANSGSSFATRSADPDMKFRAATAATEIKNELSDRLFGNTGANQNIFPAEKTQAVAQLMKDAQNGVKGAAELARRVSEANSIQEINGLHSDLINGNQIAQASKGTLGKLAQSIVKGGMVGAGAATHGVLGALGGAALSPAVEAAAGKIEGPINRTLARAVSNTGPTTASPGVTGKVAGTSLANLPVGTLATAGLNPSSPENTTPTTSSANPQADYQTAQQRLNNWYSQAKAATAFMPQFSDQVDAQYNAQKANIQQNQLSKASQDIQSRLANLPTGPYNIGVIDWLRRNNDPNYSAVARDLDFINTVTKDMGAPANLDTTSTNAQIQNALQSIQGILSGAPSATAKSTLPAFATAGGQ